MEEEEQEMLKLQQRVAHLEAQLADSIRQHNQEAGDLQNSLVRLRSQLEQGEAQRHSLEYQLTLAQKDGRQNVDLLEQRESKWNTLKESLQDHVSKLTQQCQDWRSTLDTVQEARAKERAEQQQLMAKKESQLLQQTTLYRKLELAHQQLKSDNISTTESLSALQTELTRVEGELSSTAKTVQVLNHELATARDVGENYKLRLKASEDRARSLEASTESLKSDLHTVQLNAESQSQQNRELEAILADESLSHNQVARALEETRKLLGSVQNSLKREEGQCSALSDQLHSKEQECQTLRQQKREKQSMISELSHQLQLHKTNLQALKEELNVAKQRQSLMEESHNCSLKGVDTLINSFQAKYLLHTGHCVSTPCTDVSQLPDKVRQTLVNVQSHLTELGSKINNLTSDVKTERQKLDQMSKQCATYHEVVTARTTAMAEAELRLSANSKEIFRLNSELSHSETIKATLESQVEQLTQQVQQTHSKHTSTLDELSALKETYTEETASHCSYLHSLLASLAVSKPTGSSSKGSSRSDLADWGSDPTKWEALAGSVTTSVMAVAEALKRTKKEARYLKATNGSLVATLESAEALYKESAEKLASSMEAQERQWTQRTNELKSQYTSKLVESEEKCVDLEQQIVELKRENNKLSTERDQCMTLLSKAEQRIEELTLTINEKAKNVSTLAQEAKEWLNKEREWELKNEQLQDQLSQMQDAHRGYKNDRACLLACTCLLTGSLFPALARVQELAAQQSILLRQLECYERLCTQLTEIVQSIQSDIEEPQSQTTLENSQCSMLSCSKSPLLNFRKVSIAILAVNRLRKLCKSSYSLFSVDVAIHHSSTQHILVHIGQRAAKHSKQTSSTQQRRHQSTDIASWLRSERVLSDVRDSFSDLQSTLDAITSHQGKQSQSPSKQRTSSKLKVDNQRSIINPTRDCFLQLLERMSPRFSKDTQVPLSNDSLCYRLGRGLERALQRSSQHCYSNSTELSEGLHTQLTSLVGRLHEGELKRHTISLELEQHKTEVARLSNACCDALELENQVEKLREDLAGMVPHERYISVCGDLESALKREQDLKASLTQHGVAVRQLQTRLQQEGLSIQNKSAALCVLEKELSEVRVNLEHREDQLKDTRKHLELTNKERMSQAQQLGELQSALNTCRRQISMAHAAVTAESDRRLSDKR